MVKNKELEKKYLKKMNKNWIKTEKKIKTKKERKTEN